MIPPRLLSRLFLAAALALTVAAAHAAPDPFDRTRQRIGALLDHHRQPPALPEKPSNPFLFTGNRPAVPATPAAPVETPALDDDRILAYCVSRLRISGQVLRGGVAHVLINAATYREGDLVPVPGAGEIIYYVKVDRILPQGIAFSYNDATLTVPIRG